MNKERVQDPVTDDDLRAVQRERDDALRALDVGKDQTRLWVAEVTEVRPL